MEQTFQFSNVFKIPAVIQIVNENITTDITGVKILKLAKNLRKFKASDLYTEMLPGNFATIDGLSYWVHNKEQTKQLVDRMIANDQPQISGIVTP